MDTEPPLQDLEKIDRIESNDAGRVELQILPTGPLTADSETQQYLLAKIETYLCYINSTGFRRQYGTPSESSITISVACPPPIDPDIEDLVVRMQSWVRDNRASIRLIESEG